MNVLNDAECREQEVEVVRSIKLKSPARVGGKLFSC